MLKYGLHVPINWNPEKAPHIAFSGTTGTGKTYAVKEMLAKISKYNPESHITVCDFKGDDDFKFLDGCERFYRFEACIEGFKQYYTNFLEVQKKPEKRNGMQILLFDEWAAAVNYLDKKEGEELKKMLASLLMLGRSFDHHIIVSQQRLDADSFAKARDNFNVVITLGNPSKEVIGMLYSDYKDEIKNDRTRGTGYMLVNGSDFKKIVVPTVNSMDAVNSAIRKAVER